MAQKICLAVLSGLMYVTSKFLKNYLVGIAPFHMYGCHCKILKKADSKEHIGTMGLSPSAYPFKRV